MLRLDIKKLYHPIPFDIFQELNKNLKIKLVTCEFM